MTFEEVGLREKNWAQAYRRGGGDEAEVGLREKKEVQAYRDK